MEAKVVYANPKRPTLREKNINDYYDYYDYYYDYYDYLPTKKAAQATSHKLLSCPVLVKINIDNNIISTY